MGEFHITSEQGLTALLLFHPLILTEYRLPIREKSFNVGPNDAQLVRVFTRKSGAFIANVVFASQLAFEAVIDCEAGTAIHATGARYEMKIDILDFSTMTSIVRSAIVAAGSLGDVDWPTEAQQFVFPIAAPGAINEDHVWKIFASLKIGVTNPHTSLAESDLFLITTP